MICSAKHSPAAFALMLSKSKSLRPRSSSALPPISSSASENLNSARSSIKPLYLTPRFGFGSRDGSVPAAEPRGLSFKRTAYEANSAEGIALPNEEASAAAAQRLKIGIYFATWWSLNVVFNIYNKKVLNAFPYPWLTSTLSLAAGSLIMLISWASRVAETPKIDLDFLKALAPVRN